MCVEEAPPRSLVIELRQQAHYYRALHARAVEREATARAEVQRLKQIVRDQQAQIAELTQQIEALGAKVAWLRQQVFGRKSEQAPGIADQTRGAEQREPQAVLAGLSGGLRRQRRETARGSGGFFALEPDRPAESRLGWSGAIHMSTQPPHAPIRYCGRLFTSEALEQIRRLIASDPRLNRAQLSRRVCDQLGWRRPDGRRKDMSCRVAMLRMERDGLITLPPPQKRNGNGRNRPRLRGRREEGGPT